MAVKDVTINFTTKDKDITRTKNKFDELNESANNSTNSVKNLEKQSTTSFSNMNKSLLKLGGALAGAFAIKEIAMSAINTIREYDKAIAQLSAVTGASGKELDKFKQKVIEVSKNTGKGASDIANAFQLVGSAQPELLKSADGLAAVTEQAVLLSKAGGIGVQEAATALTQSMNQFGASAEDAAMFSDLLAKSQQGGTATIEQLSESMVRAGGTAKAFGLDFKETNILLQAFAKGGVVGAEAGTQLSGVLSKLAKVENEEFNPAKTNAVDVINNLKDANMSYTDLLKLTDAEGAKWITTLLNQTEVIDTLTESIDNQDGVLEQANKAYDTLDGKLEKVGSSWDRFVLSMDDGSSVIGQAFKGILDGISNMFDGLTDLTTYDWGKENLFTIWSSYQQVLYGVENTTKDFGQTLANIDAQFSRLTDKQRSNREVIEQMVGVYQKMGLSADEIKEKINSFRAEEVELTDALDENTDALDENNKGLEKQLSFLDKLAEYVKETKKKIEDEELMNTIFGDDAVDEEFMADIVSAGDKELEYLNEKNKNILEADKELNDALKEQKDNAFNEMIEQRMEHDEIEAQLNEEKYALFLQTTQMFTDQLGNTFAAAMINNEEMAKASSKAMVLTLLDAVERVVLLSIAQTQALALASPESVATLGAAGLAKGVIMTALIKGAFGAIKAQITQNFRDGVIDLAGAGTSQTDSIPANLSAGESVMTSKETKEHKPLLLAIRNNKLDDYLQKEYLPQFYMGKIATNKTSKKSGAYSDFSELIKLQKRGTKITNHKQISKPILDAITEANFVNRNGW